MTTYALRKEGIFRVQFQSCLIIGLVAAITGNAHIAGSDALYRTIFVIENPCGCETGENLYAQTFRRFGKPAEEIAERAIIGALLNRQSVGTGRDGSVRVDTIGRRIIKNK